MADCEVNATCGESVIMIADEVETETSHKATETKIDSSDNKRRYVLRVRKKFLEEKALQPNSTQATFIRI